MDHGRPSGRPWFRSGRRACARCMPRVGRGRGEGWPSGMPSPSLRGRRPFGVYVRALGRFPVGMSCYGRSTSPELVACPLGRGICCWLWRFSPSPVPEAASPFPGARARPKPSPVSIVRVTVREGWLRLCHLRGVGVGVEENHGRPRGQPWFRPGIAFARGAWSVLGTDEVRGGLRGSPHQVTRGGGPSGCTSEPCGVVQPSSVPAAAGLFRVSSCA